MITATLTKENISLWWLTHSPVVQYIVIIVGHDSIQAEMVMER